MTTLPTDEPSEYRLIRPSGSGALSNLLDGMDRKQSKHRLQALIAQWLRMENLVVLAGAGASVSSGGKTMASLEDAVLNTIKIVSGAPSAVSSIIDSRLAEADRCGFELWLSLLVNAQYIGCAPGTPFTGVQWKAPLTATNTELAWFVKHAGASIFAECALLLPDAALSLAASEIAPHLGFLAKLIARDSNLGRAHLFTLNYDTLFEQALELLGIQYSDGFSGRAEARFDPAVYGLDIYYPGEIAEGRVRRFDKFVHLYKLHGSIHWQIRGDEVRARHPDLNSYVEYRKLAYPARAAKLEEWAKALPWVGILPTANKFSQTLAMPFAHLFRSFQIRLSVPQTFLLVLGYGFGDDHVNRIIETALTNPSLVMLIVEPNPGSATVERVRRYKDLGKRVFVLTPTEDAFRAAPYQHATFDDFARSIMPDVQWLDDFLRLRRYERDIAASRREENDKGGVS